MFYVSEFEHVETRYAGLETVLTYHHCRDDEINYDRQGALGGQVPALRLNVDFSEAGFTAGAAAVPFGDLTLCNFTTPAINGFSVRRFLDVANTLLGGGSSTYSIVDNSPITASLDGSFDGGLVSTFAQQHHRQFTYGQLT